MLCIIFLSIVLLLTAADKHNCKPNETWEECGACEASCSNKENDKIPCQASCQPPRCECVATEGFVRDDSGNCIKVEDCPKLE